MRLNFFRFTPYRRSVAQIRGTSYLRPKKDEQTLHLVEVERRVVGLETVDEEPDVAGGARCRDERGVLGRVTCTSRWRE